MRLCDFVPGASLPCRDTACPHLVLLLLKHCFQLLKVAELELHFPQLCLNQRRGQRPHTLFCGPCKRLMNGQTIIKVRKEKKNRGAGEHP